MAVHGELLLEPPTSVVSKGSPSFWVLHQGAEGGVEGRRILGHGEGSGLSVDHRL